MVQSPRWPIALGRRPPVNQYLVRDNETYEPLAMFPAPDGISAALIMRKYFGNREVHVLNINSWTFEQKAEALIEIISNCPTHLPAFTLN
jgi:hypothetical protein